MAHVEPERLIYWEVVEERGDPFTGEQPYTKPQVPKPPRKRQRKVAQVDPPKGSVGVEVCGFQYATSDGHNIVCQLPVGHPRIDDTSFGDYTLPGHTGRQPYVEDE